MASKDLEGIRERTPKRVGPFYDEPSGNERRLRGVAARTPKRTISMDEKYAKEAPVRHGMGTRTGARKPTRVSAARKLAAIKSKRSDIETESDTRQDKIEPEETKTFSAKARAIPQASSSSEQASSSGSAAAPKKKGKLRRAIGGIGKAARFVGRGVGKAFKDNARKRVS